MSTKLTREQAMVLVIGGPAIAAVIIGLGLVVTTTFLAGAAGEKAGSAKGGQEAAPQVTASGKG